jgi:YVTN family beta-propeller protein
MTSGRFKIRSTWIVVPLVAILILSFSGVAGATPTPSAGGLGNGSHGPVGLTDAGLSAGVGPPNLSHSTLGSSGRPNAARNPAVSFPPFVRSTLILLNGTLAAGNDLAGNGEGPYGAVLIPGSGQLVIPDEGSGYLSVLNVTTNQLVTVGPVGGSPSAIAFDPTHDLLLVADQGTGEVSVVSASNYSVLARVDVGSAPDAIAYDPLNGTTYVVNSDSNNVTVINDSSMAVTATIPVGNYPDGVAVDNHTDQIFVTDYSDDNVSIINASSNTVVKTVGVGSGPKGLVFDYLSNKVYVANSAGEDLSIIRDSTDSVTHTQEYGYYTSPQTIAFDPANGTLYVTEGFADLSPVNNVTLVNISTGGPVLNISVGLYPYGIAYDPADQSVFVVNSASENVSRVSTVSNDVTATISVGTHPHAILYDPDGSGIWVSDTDSNNLTLFNLTSGQLVGYVPTGTSPFALALDPALGQLLVTDESSNEVTLVNTTTHSATDTVPVASEPIAASFDPFNGDYYLSTSLDGGALAIFSSASDSVIGNITSVGVLPRSSVFVPSLNETYVSDLGSGTVSIVSDATNTLVANVVVGTSPLGVALDPARGEVYVADSGSDQVSVINISTHAVVATVPVGSQPWGIADDPAAGEVFVTNSGSNNVTVINTTTHTVVANIGVGALPIGIAYDPTGELILVANENQGTVSIVQTVNTTFALTFQESGLPASTLWSASVGGTSHSSTNSSVTFSEPNGTAVYSIGHVAGYHSTPSSGSVVISGKPALVNVTFTPNAVQSYPVTFSAQGLPSGATFGVTLNGSTMSSSGGSLVFDEPNGSFPFSVGSVTDYRATPTSGAIVVQGGPVDQTIVFTENASVTYAVDFVESGLAPGTGWSVSLNGTVNGSVTPEIGFEVASGTFTFNVASVPPYSASPSHGSVPVTGPTTVTIQFTIPTYIATFTESGLPSSTNWTVNLGGAPHGTTSASIHLDLANGSYPWTVSSVSGFTATPMGGTLSVTGANVTTAINFAQNSTTTGPPSNSTSNAGGLGLSVLDWAIIGVIVAVVVAILAVVLTKYRRRGAPPESHP